MSTLSFGITVFLALLQLLALALAAGSFRQKLETQGEQIKSIKDEQGAQGKTLHQMELGITRLEGRINTLEALDEQDSRNDRGEKSGGHRPLVPDPFPRRSK